MERIYPELALYCRTNEGARTDTVYFPIFQVSKGTVSLSMSAHTFVSMSGLGGMEAQRDFYVGEGNLKSVYRQI